MGVVSKSLVHENIGWVGKFNVSDGTELEVPAFANGSLLSALTDVLVDGLNTKGYIFLRNFVGLAGTYINDSHTAVAITSDYADIEKGRSIDKCVRLVYAALLPRLNSPVYPDATTGKISRASIKELETLCEAPIRQMVANGELTAGKAYIDPNQNVLATSTVNITLKLVPVGVARNINVSIGYTVKLQ